MVAPDSERHFPGRLHYGRFVQIESGPHTIESTASMLRWMWQVIRNKLNLKPSPRAIPIKDKSNKTYWMVWQDEAQTEAFIRRQGVPVAVVTVEWNKLPDAYLSGIHINHPKYKGHGLGSCLMGIIIDLARSKGARSIYGEVSRPNLQHTPHLLDIYRHWGFTVTPIQNNPVWIARIKKIL